jgi:hypothetical protein
MIKDVLAWVNYLSSCLSVIAGCLRKAIEEWPRLPDKDKEGS